MKGKMKKLVALALAAIMVLAMGITASAEGTGTITMKNATPNTRYVAFRLFDANPAVVNPIPDGGVTSTDQVAYTATADQKAWFDAYNVAHPDKNHPFDFTETANSKVFNVTQKEGTTDADVVNFLNGLYTSEEVNGETVYKFADNFAETYAEAKIEKNADENGNLVFDNAPYGYYLITSGLGATVTVTSTNPNANVIDKNISKPTMGEKVIRKADGTTTTTDSVNYGDTINFEVDVISSNYEGDKLVTQYDITDALDEGLSYVRENGKIKITVEIWKKDASGNFVKEKSLTEATNPTNNQYSVQDNNNSFKITIPWATGTIDSDGNVIASSVVNYYAQGVKILVKYSATVNNDADLGVALENNATFHYYLNNLTTPENPNEPSKKTETFTFAFDLVKTNEGADGVKQILSGAEFSLYPTVDSTDAIEFVVEKNDPEDNTVITGYHKASDTEIADDDLEITTTLIAGNVTIKGLAGGVKTIVTDGDKTTETTVVESKSYWLEETKAPAGYNELDGRKEVKFENGNLQNVVLNDDEDYVSGGFNVVNVAGSLLPSTGGIGTTIFYVVGGLLVVGAGILLVTKKRMHREQ